MHSAECAVRSDVSVPASDVPLVDELAAVGRVVQGRVRTRWMTASHASRPGPLSSTRSATASGIGRALEPASAIVLAGGRSSRFGAEKLAAEVDGQPLLHHALRAAAQVCDEVLVVGAPSGLPVALPDGMARTPVVILDVDPYEGPLVALVNSSGHATHERVLLIAGDMPELQPAILERVLAWSTGRDGACLVVDGWPQPFPMGLDRATAVKRGAELVAAGERSLRRLMGSLNMEQVAEAEWRALDSEARSLRDIDRPGDLERITHE